MTSAYTKSITIAKPDNVEADAILQAINAHLGGSNVWPASRWQNDQGQLYSVLSFAAKADFSVSVPEGVLMADDAIGTNGLAQIAAMGLTAVVE